MNYLQNPHQFCNKQPEDFRIGQTKPGEWWAWIRTPLAERDPDIQGDQFDPIIRLPDFLVSSLNDDQREDLLTLVASTLNDGYRIGHSQGQKAKAWDIAAALNLKGDVI